MTKTFQDFKDALAAHESGSESYSCKNKLGYLGKYQFGLARLCDFDLTERNPDSHGFGNGAFHWVSPFTEEMFLGTPELQERIFERHVRDLARYVWHAYREFDGHEIEGVTFTLSGAVAVCHLLGRGGLIAFTEGKDLKDAFGTHASKYMRELGGYDMHE